MYVEPKIKSSYYVNNKGSKLGEPYFKPNIGKTIYDYVIETKPKVIVEFGVLFGFSTVCMSQALRDLNNGGKIYAFDLWEKSKYNHGQTLVIPRIFHKLENVNIENTRVTNLQII